MTLYKDVAVEYKDGEQENGGYIVAYASTFDREPDAYGDVVAKGAFVKSLEKHEAESDPIQFLFGHRTDDPMYNIGSVVEAKEDDNGLLIKAQFDPENEKAQYARKLVKEGRLKKLSFAYDVIDQATVVLDDGTKANELREVDIFEVSLVPIPANQHAQVVDVKSGDPEVKAGRVLSSKNEDDLQQAVSLIQGVLSQLETDASNDEPKEAVAVVKVVPDLTDFKEQLSQQIDEAITEAAKASVLASEETPEDKKEGDPSSAEASADGGKGAPAVDEDFLAKYRKYTDQKEEK